MCHLAVVAQVDICCDKCLMRGEAKCLTVAMFYLQTREKSIRQLLTSCMRLRHGGVRSHGLNTEQMHHIGLP